VTSGLVAMVTPGPDIIIMSLVDMEAACKALQIAKT
jgi:hypothetical protein